MCNYLNMSYALMTWHWVIWCTRITCHVYLMTLPSNCPTPRTCISVWPWPWSSVNVKPSKSIYPASCWKASPSGQPQFYTVGTFPDPVFLDLTPVFLPQCLPSCLLISWVPFPLMSSLHLCCLSVSGSFLHS